MMEVHTQATHQKAQGGNHLRKLGVKALNRVSIGGETHG